MRQYRPFGKPGAGAPIYEHQHNRLKVTEHEPSEEEEDNSEVVLH